MVLMPMLFRSPAFETQPAPDPRQAEAGDVVSHPALHAATPGQEHPRASMHSTACSM